MKRHFLGAALPVLLPVATALMVAGADAGAQAPRLDPFARPVLPKPAPLPAGEGPEIAAVPAWQPELRAVMFDGPRSLVDISGRILAIGESHAGYKVLSIQERGAVLEKQGSRLQLMLDKEKTK